jgi:RsmE family RNA methyltransferase
VNVILFESAELTASEGSPVRGVKVVLKRRDERAIHLVKVLHKKSGDSFDAGVLDGKLGKGRIDSIRLDGSLNCSLVLNEEPPLRAPLRVGVGFPRPIQLRRLLRDLSNLGVRAIDVWGTDLGEKSYRDTNLLHDGGSREALIEGAVQARDSMLPALNTYESLDEWLARHPWKGWPILIAPDNVRPEGSMANLTANQGQAVVLAIGSERGWSERERDLLEDAGFLRLSLGSRALRTETACTVAAALALEKIGALR